MEYIGLKKGADLASSVTDLISSKMNKQDNIQHILLLLP